MIEYRMEYHRSVKSRREILSEKVKIVGLIIGKENLTCEENGKCL